MRVLLLSAEIDSSTFELSRLLERDSSVASVEISDDARSLLGADVAIIDGRGAPGVLGSDAASGACARVAVLRQSNAEERLRLLDGGADLVLHGDVSADEIVAQVRAIARRARPTEPDPPCRPTSGASDSRLNLIPRIRSSSVRSGAGVTSTGPPQTSDS